MKVFYVRDGVKVIYRVLYDISRAAVRAVGGFEIGPDIEQRSAVLAFCLN